MSDWIRLAATEEIPLNDWKVCDLEGQRVLVVHLETFFYVLEDVCSHDGASLDGGFLEGDEIVCPRHGARFCARNGEVTCPPAYEDIHSFPSKIENGYIYARDDRWD